MAVYVFCLFCIGIDIQHCCLAGAFDLPDDDLELDQQALAAQKRFNPANAPVSGPEAGESRLWYGTTTPLHLTKHVVQPLQ